MDHQTGVIYGSTQYGGSGRLGTVFSLTPSASGYSERVLYSFTSHRDGFEPEAPLLLTGRGDLYGTTTLAGSGCRDDCGTIFRLVPAGSGSYAFHLVYAFAGAPDGTDPVWSGLAAGPHDETDRARSAEVTSRTAREALAAGAITAIRVGSGQHGVPHADARRTR